MRSGHVSSVMGGGSHLFSKAPQASIPRSQFDRSSGFKTTFNAGYLVPIFVDEVLPGDTFSLNVHGFARLATPIFPIMDNMHMETFFFFVPNRLVWDNWQRFMGEQRDPGDSTDFLIPQVVAPAVTGWTEGSIADYFGLPTGVPLLSQNALPFRALNLCFNEWFRDENLQDSLDVPRDDGPDDPAIYNLFRRCKRYDYFTGCLPWPQKGPAVDVPLGTRAPVLGDDNSDLLSPWRMYSEDDPGWPNPTTYGDMYVNGPAGIGATTPVQMIWTQSIGSGTHKIVPSPYLSESTLYADLTDATAVTINTLRQAFQTQKLFERDARGGTRYIEIIHSHFGVRSPDARLQRPEYLGGGSSPVIISPVAQTSSTDGTSPQGNLSAIGTCALKGHGFTKSFVEHGFIIGLVNVRADLNYQQGLSRMWSRQTRFDHYWPALSHIGEQAVLNKEIYAQGPAAINPSTGIAYDEEAFGYQERYAEYRYKPSLVTGLFRTAATGTLDSWHLTQNFGSLPALNASFIEENPPMARIKAVTGQPDFIFDSFIKLKCTRPLPVYSVPGYVDHF